jgi:hypothetical protein
MAGLRRLATLALCVTVAVSPAASLAQEIQVAQELAQANPFPAPIGKPPAQPQQPRPQQPQPGAQPAAAAGDAVGSVASVTLPANVARGGAGPSALKKGDPIRQGDRLSTGAGGALAVTFDDETTFSLTASASIVVDEFVYRSGQRGSASIRVVRGTAGFVAAQVAKQGDMKITTPGAVLGVRGTTGVVDVPGNAPANVKLYQDADGAVGRIEIFGTDGNRVGELTQAATGYALQVVGQRLVATALTITAEQLLRDRNLVQRVFSFRNIGRQLNIRRLNLRDLAPGNLNPRNLDPRRDLYPRNLPRQVPQIPGLPGLPGIPGLGR